MHQLENHLHDLFHARSAILLHHLLRLRRQNPLTHILVELELNSSVELEPEILQVRVLFVEVLLVLPRHDVVHFEVVHHESLLPIRRGAAEEEEVRLGLQVKQCLETRFGNGYRSIPRDAVRPKGLRQVENVSEEDRV